MNNNKHVSQWLNAYHDGELRPNRKALVEAHLEVCPQCQAELQEYQMLSAILQADPLPQMRTSPEQFAAQVALRLPRGESGRQNSTNFSWRWYAVPIGFWILFGIQRTLLAVYSALSGVEQLVNAPGILTQILPSPAAQPGPGLLADLSSTLLNWGNPFKTPLGLAILLPLALIVGYLGWLLLWWTEQNQNDIEGVRS